MSFFKDLISSDGHPFKCIQKVIEIRHARSADRAIQAAEIRYERLHHVHDWTLHSDCLELEINGEKVDYCPTGLVKRAADKLPGLCEAAQTQPVAKSPAKSRKVKLGATTSTD